MPGSRAVWLFRVGLGLGLGVAASELAFHVPAVRDSFCSRYRVFFEAHTPPFWRSDRYRIDDPKVGKHLRSNWEGDLIYPHGVVHMRTNRDGFRFRDLSYKKPAGTDRIAFYGNSVLLSKEIPEEFTLSDRLEELLGDAGRHVECMNFGVENTSLSDWIRRHIHYGSRYHPDLAVIVDPGAVADRKLLERDPETGDLRLVEMAPGPRTRKRHDFRQALIVKSRLVAVEERFEMELQYHRPLDSLFANWGILARPAGNAARTVEVEGESAKLDEIIQKEAEQYVTGVRLFADRARSDGVRRVVIVWVRTPQRWARPKRDARVRERIAELLAQEPEERGIVLLDARPLLDGRPESDWYLPRYNHFHGGGTAELSSWLAGPLLEMLDTGCPEPSEPGESR